MNLSTATTNVLIKIQTFWANNKTKPWMKWLIAITLITITYPIVLKLISTLFGSGKTAQIYTLPGTVKYLLLLALLVGGVVTGEKNNKASFALSLAVTGVLFFFFSPILTSWVTKISDVMPAYFVAGILLVGFGIVAKKIMTLPRLSIVLFIAGAVFTMMSLVPITMPKNITMPTNKVHEVWGLVLGLGLIKSLLIGACALLWIKKPQSVSRFLLAGIIAISVYKYTDSMTIKFLNSHHEIARTLHIQRDSGRASLRRLNDENVIKNIRKDVLSHRKVANAGMLYIPRSATLCEEIKAGVCKPANISLSSSFTQVFILGETKTIGSYSWEKVAIDTPTGKTVWVFSGDIVEKNEITARKAAEAKAEEQKLLDAGWTELVCSAPDADGFVSVVTPSEAISKTAIIFDKEVVAERANGDEKSFRNPKKILRFHNGIRRGGLPDLKFKSPISPGEKIWVKFQ